MCRTSHAAPSPSSRAIQSSVGYLGRVAALKVLVDGVALPEAEGRALWQRFSAHMEAHRGDLEGFAKSEGFASVHPVMGTEGAELHASRTTAQRPYQTAARSGPGSSGSHPGAGNRAKSRDRRRR